jgi:hypothetical protein
MVLPSLLVLSLPSGAGAVLVIVMLGSLVIGSPFIVHQSLSGIGVAAATSVPFCRLRCGYVSTLCLPAFLPGLLLLAYGGIGVPLHLLEPPQIVLDGLVLLILGLVLLLKSRLFLFPRMDGDFTRRGTALIQLAAGHVERPQLALMLPLEFFPFPFPLDTLQLVIDGFGVPVEVNKAKQ